MIKEAISLLIDGIDLSKDKMTDAMRDIMEGKATDAQIASFLTALRLKGETVDEITGAAIVMREKVTRINAPACERIGPWPACIGMYRYEPDGYSFPCDSYIPSST